MDWYRQLKALAIGPSLQWPEKPYTPQPLRPVDYTLYRLTPVAFGCHLCHEQCLIDGYQLTQRHQSEGNTRMRLLQRPTWHVGLQLISKEPAVAVRTSECCRMMLQLVVAA